MPLPSPVSRRQESLTCRHFTTRRYAATTFLCIMTAVPAVGSGEAAATVNGTSAGKPAGSRPPLGIRKSPAGCPMPEDAPDNLAAVQLLRLKAKVSARLHLHTEVRTIHARLGNKYQHIEELIKNIQP